MNHSTTQSVVLLVMSLVLFACARHRLSTVSSLSSVSHSGRGGAMFQGPETAAPPPFTETRTPSLISAAHSSRNLKHAQAVLEVDQLPGVHHKRLADGACRVAVLLLQPLDQTHHVHLALDWLHRVGQVEVHLEGGLLDGLAAQAHRQAAEDGAGQVRGEPQEEPMPYGEQARERVHDRDLHVLVDAQPGHIVHALHAEVAVVLVLLPGLDEAPDPAVPGKARPLAPHHGEYDEAALLELVLPPQDVEASARQHVGARTGLKLERDAARLSCSGPGPGSPSIQ